MDARRIGLLVAGLAAVVVLFLVFRSGDDDETAATTSEPAATTATTETTATQTGPTTATEPPPPPPPPPAAAGPAVVRIRIVDGVPAGGIKSISVKEGRKVTLVVTSDVTDHVHVHGIDLMKDIAPGPPARLTFTAKPAGRYEVELEDRGVQIADLKVNP